MHSPICVADEADCTCHPTCLHSDRSLVAPLQETTGSDQSPNWTVDETYLSLESNKALAARKEPVNACNSWVLLRQKTPQDLEADTSRYLALLTFAHGRGEYLVLLELLDLFHTHKDVKLSLSLLPVNACNSWVLLRQKTPQELETDTSHKTFHR